MNTLIVLIQCYATISQSGCQPLQYVPSLTECHKLATQFTQFDNRAIKATNLPALVSYKCKVYQ